MQKRWKRIVVITWLVLICYGAVYGWWKNFEAYHVVVQSVNETETTIDIANKYMQTEYDNLWKSVDGVAYAGQESEIVSDYVYEIMMWEIVDDAMYHRAYSIWNDAKDGICCETKIGSPGITISSKYFGKEGEVDAIFCVVDVYNEEGYWDEKLFNLYCESGEYVCYIYENHEYLKVDMHDIEKIMELTSDEIVLIAKEQHGQVEKLMSKVKDQDLKNEKIQMIIKNGGILIFILVNGGIAIVAMKKEMSCNEGTVNE